MSPPPVLNHILMELHSFLLTLDKENLSGKATVQKGLLSDLLLSYRGSNGTMAPSLCGVRVFALLGYRVRGVI